MVYMLNTSTILLFEDCSEEDLSWATSRLVKTITEGGFGLESLQEIVKGYLFLSFSFFFMPREEFEPTGAPKLLKQRLWPLGMFKIGVDHMDCLRVRNLFSWRSVQPKTLHKSVLDWSGFFLLKIIHKTFNNNYDYP